VSLVSDSACNNRMVGGDGNVQVTSPYSPDTLLCNVHCTVRVWSLRGHYTLSNVHLVMTKRRYLHALRQGEGWGGGGK
jgi:hypothetical protein